MTFYLHWRGRFVIMLFSLGRYMKKKKKYHKPRIKTEKIDIRVAVLQCGKCSYGNPIFQGGCLSVPRFS